MDKLGNRPDEYTAHPWIEDIFKDRAAEIAPVKIVNRISITMDMMGRTIQKFRVTHDWSQCNNVTKKRYFKDIEVD
jgi:hypothetical protein